MQANEDRIIRTIHKTDSVTIVKDLLVADSPPLRGVRASNETSDSQDDLSVRPPSSSISLGNGGTSSGESTPEPTLITRTSSDLLTPPSMDSAYGIKRGPSPPPVVFVTPSALSRQDIERRRQQAKEGDVSIQASLLHVSGPLRVPDRHFGKAKCLVRKENMRTIKVPDDVLENLPQDDVSHNATCRDDADDVTDSAPSNDVTRAAKSQDNTATNNAVYDETQVDVPSQMDHDASPVKDADERYINGKTLQEEIEEDNLAATTDSIKSDMENGEKIINGQDDINNETNNNAMNENNDFFSDGDNFPENIYKMVKFYDADEEEEEDHIKMRKTPYQSPEPDDIDFSSDDENNNANSANDDVDDADDDESTENVKLIEELDDDFTGTMKKVKSVKPVKMESDFGKSQEVRNIDVPNGDSENEGNEETDLEKGQSRKKNRSGGSHHSELTEHEYESDGEEQNDDHSCRSNSSKADFTDSMSDVSLDEHLQDSAGETTASQQQDEESVTMATETVTVKTTLQSPGNLPTAAKVPAASAAVKTQRLPARAPVARRPTKPATSVTSSDQRGRQPRPPWKTTTLAPKDLDSIPRLRLPKDTTLDRTPVSTLYTEQRIRLSPSPIGRTATSVNGNDVIGPSSATERQVRNPPVPIQLRSNAYVDNGKLCITLKGPSRALPEINVIGNAGDKEVKKRSDSVPMDVKIMFIRDDRTFRQKLRLPPLGSTRRRPRSYSPSPDRNILENRAVHGPFNTRVEQSKNPAVKNNGKDRLSRATGEGSSYCVRRD